MSPDAPAAAPAGPSSDRVRLRRGAHLGRYRHDDVRAVLDEAPVDAPDLPPGIRPRPAIEALAGRPAHDRDRG